VKGVDQVGIKELGGDGDCVRVKLKDISREIHIDILRRKDNETKELCQRRALSEPGGLWEMDAGQPWERITGQVRRVEEPSRK
jgi:hypothetical protein